MSEQGNEGGGGGDGENAEVVRGALVGPTMQVDAVADADAVLEDSSAGEEDAPELPDAAVDAPPRATHAPPPLPKRGPKKSVVMMVLAIVLVLSVGAAFAASSLLTPALPVPATRTRVAPTHAAAAPTPVIVAPAVVEAPPRVHTRVTIEAIEITGGATEQDAGRF